VPGSPVEFYKETDYPISGHPAEKRGLKNKITPLHVLRLTIKIFPDIPGALRKITVINIGRDLVKGLKFGSVKIFQRNGFTLNSITGSGIYLVSIETAFENSWMMPHMASSYVKTRAITGYFFDSKIIFRDYLLPKTLSCLKPPLPNYGIHVFL